MLSVIKLKCPGQKSRVNEAKTCISGNLDSVFCSSITKFDPQPLYFVSCFQANEIAFINKLEAQNKKHDIVVRHQGHEARLHDIMEERQRRQEEKAAKEEAAQERRKALECERQERLEAMQSQRKIQEEKINVLRAQRDVARESAAKEKAR